MTSTIIYHTFTSLQNGGKNLLLFLLSRVARFIIHMLWMAAQLASITEDELWNIKTQFSSHSPVLKVLSHMVTAEEKQQVTRADISNVKQRTFKWLHTMMSISKVFIPGQRKWTGNTQNSIPAVRQYPCLSSLQHKQSRE